jgi:hypothetical protein
MGASETEKDAIGKILLLSRRKGGAQLSGQLAKPGSSCPHAAGTGQRTRRTSRIRRFFTAVVPPGGR